MKLITVDFETYYDNDYSLTKMSTEDYVNDPRFSIIMCGIKINGTGSYWVDGKRKQDLAQEFEEIKLREHGMLAHHNMFDGLILARHFGIYPSMYFDTRLLAQANLKPFLRSVSLDSCLKHLPLGIQKGTVVHNMKGRTRDSLSSVEMDAYGEYCCTDVDGEFALFKYLAPQFPRSELEVMDMILRMYLQPGFQLDASVLAVNLAEVRAKQHQVMQSLPSDIQKADLMSNPKFAEVLSRYGVEPPLKISAKTGQAAFAFAKTDTGWKELEDDWADDPVVSSILAARLSAKSTIEVTRSERLLHIAQRYKAFRIPLLYYAAHTGRLGGMESINAQNFPRVDKSKMRFAVKAPPGCVVLAADLAQIEARITAWLAGQQDLLQAFREKRDIYSEFATVAFGIETIKGRSKEDDKRRFVGKTCILGLGFGMSAARLRATLRKDGVILSIEECDRLVNVYRAMKYPKIPKMWRTLDGYIGVMSSGAGKVKFGPCTLAKDSIILPNGMALVYHKLRHVTTDKYSGWVYNFSGEVRTLWGGKTTENIVQALARILVMAYMLEIKHAIKLSPALQQHDELDYIVPVQYAEKVKAVIGKIMRVPPSWAPDLPVEVEINYGATLGDCK